VEHNHVEHDRVEHDHVVLDIRHVVPAVALATGELQPVGGAPAASVLSGWEGAAPTVIDGGVAWRREEVVVIRLTPASPSVSHGTEAPVLEPRRPVEPLHPAVSRETSLGEADEAGDPIDASEFERDFDTRESSVVAASVQTAPVHREWQDEDGSGRMRQSSIAPAVTEESATRTVTTGSGFGYDDEHRLDLANSLPRVDESTPLAFEVAEDARRRISLVGRPFPQPPHTRVLTVANQKGGVGKTTTTVNVAAAMAQSGLNVLVLDIDPQGNASTALGIDHHSEIPSLYDVVVEQRPLGEVLQSCPDIPNLLCAPATIDLAGAEIELVSLVAREVRLQRALREYLEKREADGLPRIDYVFIDCPPSLSLLTVNAFVAADEVFIPIQCEYYALEGLSQLLKHVELIRGHLNPTLHVSTILLTMYDGRTRLSSQVADEVRAHFPETVLKTTVPRSVRISEAPSHAQTVMTYDPASSGALSYLEASRELAEQVLTWADGTRQEERA
jgi:chromosome partitioning protein